MTVYRARFDPNYMAQYTGEPVPEDKQSQMASAARQALANIGRELGISIELKVGSCGSSWDVDEDGVDYETTTRIRRAIRDAVEPIANTLEFKPSPGANPSRKR